MAQALADVRVAIRSLCRAPAYSLPVVLVLTLGIGANAAVFSALDRLVIEPLPYADPGRLAALWEDFSAFGAPKQRVSPATYLDWQRRSRAFSAIAAYRLSALNLSGDGAPEEARGIGTSANLLPMLGASTQVGRLFAASDDQPGARVVVISDGLWQRRFGRNPATIGRPLVMNGEPYTVVGIMAPGFHFPDVETEYWVPLGLTPQLAARRNSHFLHVIGRLSPGRTWADARVEMNEIARQLSTEYPATNARVGITVVRLKEELLAGADRSVLILLAAAACVLLIGCANAANLVLARGSARRRELAVRLALGAPRGAIVRNVLLETAILSAVAAGLGLLIAYWTVDLVSSLVPAAFADRALQVDGRVVLFASAAAALCSLLSGVVPAVSASPGSLLPSLGSGAGQIAGASGRRLRDALVVGEIALALVLLAAAGLLIETVVALQSRDPGFRSDRVLTATIAVPLPKYADAAARARFYDDVIARVETIPGVESVGLTSDLPFKSRGNTMAVTVEDRENGSPVGRDALFRLVSADYLETIGARLRAGRLLDRRDGSEAPPVVVVNEAFVREYLPGVNALGHRIDCGTGTNGPLWMTIVGVVADIRERGADLEAKAAVYVPFAQTAISFFQPSDIAVRASVEPMSLAVPLQRAVWSVDPEQPVSRIRPFDAIIDDNLASRRDVLRLLGAFAVLAVVLAAVGVYGVFSYVVVQSRREIGIRIAVGASPQNVIRSVLGYAARLTAFGLVAGLAGSISASRLIAALLVDVSPLDPRALISASALLAAVAAVAAYGPARRAASIDPIVTLRADP